MHSWGRLGYGGPGKGHEVGVYTSLFTCDSQMMDTGRRQLCSWTRFPAAFATADVVLAAKYTQLRCGQILSRP